MSTQVITDRSLLATFEERATSPHELRACINSHGLYNRVQFVLRLSPVVHQKLAGSSVQIIEASQVPFDKVQAFSTLLHETIHWWQHMGSTAGLLLSLGGPVQIHSSFPQLQTFLREIGPKKSILKFASTNNSTRSSPEAMRATNAIINNYKDVSFFQTIATRPDLIKKRNIGADPLFESVGHSYYITYSSTLHLLAQLFDPQFTFLPDARTWESDFAILRDKRLEGHYHGSPIRLPPLGLREIFEGQARFAQLQYLHFGSGGKFDWEDAYISGMLNAEYVDGFEVFLKLSDSEYPDSIHSPAVGLFMIVCDIAMNAGEGFPLPLLSPPTFINDNDPGMRFTFLCRMIALKAPHLKTAIRNYSQEEYILVTEQLCGYLQTPTPLEIAGTVANWSNSKDKLKALMEEDRVFRFSEANMPLRLLFARYLTYNRDKVRYPEILCWPGAWMAGERASRDVETIWHRNQALFVDKEDDDGIFPIYVRGRDHHNVYEMFNQFYDWIVSYDLLSQWIVEEGPFEYNYRWLSTTHEPNKMKGWAAESFARSLGVHPNEFEIL